MKKFSFPLDTVLNYKDQVLGSLKSEHAKIINEVVNQEKLIESIHKIYYEYNTKFNENKMRGMTINTILSYENYLKNLDNKLIKENEKLEGLKIQEDKKRQEVVEAKKETSSIEKLKEKKWTMYQKELQKVEERFIEEFVANVRTSSI